MTTKACSVCGAPTWTQSSRCSRHPKATYGRPHRRAAAPVMAAAERCHICNQPPTPNDPLVADHTMPLAYTNQHSQYLPAHRSCNARRGAPRTPDGGVSH